MELTLTVIIACFNSEKTLALTLQSILDQDFKYFEVVLVDGKSHDSTLNVIRSFESKFSEKNIAYKFLSEKDSGIYDAWNKGLNLAKGNWISFVGSDDVLRPNAFSLIAELAMKNESSDFITGKARLIKNKVVEREFGQQWQWDVFKREMKILHAGGWHNALYFTEYGVFDTSFKIVGDYELLLRKKDLLKVGFIDKFIIDMGADGVSSRLIKQSLKEVKTAKIKNGIRTSFQACIDYYWVYFKITLKSILK